MSKYPQPHDHSLGGVAAISDPMKPWAERPANPKRKTPAKAPITPITISPTRPNPFPLVMWPANQPAIIPITSNKS